MGKNAKLVLISLLICILGICLSMCSNTDASAITGENGKCDYCDEKTTKEENTNECCSHFQEYHLESERENRWKY